MYQHEKMEKIYCQVKRKDITKQVYNDTVFASKPYTYTYTIFSTHTHIHHLQYSHRKIFWSHIHQSWGWDYSDPSHYIVYNFVTFDTYFFWLCCEACRNAGSQFPDQASNPCPLQWMRGVLTTGPPGNSLFFF